MHKRMKKFLTKTFLLTTAAAALFSLTLVKNDASAASTVKGKIDIVASVDFYGETAKAVVGNQGRVQSVIKKTSVDPHDYDPTTRVAKQTSKADVLLYNGIGYDTWMGRLAKNNHKALSIRVGEDVLAKKNGDNPHLWYDTDTMPKLADYLADRFGRLKPSQKAYFKANAARYIKNEIDPITKMVDRLSKKSNDGLVDVSEPVFDYSLKELGYKENNSGFADSVENGTDPSPKDISKMQQDIRHKKIAFFLQNTQATDKTVGRLVKLAKKNKVPVLKVTETKPKNHTFRQWMMSQYRQLEKIQNNK
ncbi:metal ABC transporter solute-binding protein, Zn/Mn family [Oenococcus alcoholitolerans]|uniref:metal ABC transporter solute-binding protein, Zn/Mn family n=1 Tax=Oenococcus alcoholitolerans TaxID=931074 RepID=UPI003F72BC67